MGTSFGSDLPGAAAVDIVVVLHRLVRVVDRPDGIGAGAVGGVDPAREWSRGEWARKVEVAVGTAIHRNALSICKSGIVTKHNHN